MNAYEVQQLITVVIGLMTFFSAMGTARVATKDWARPSTGMGLFILGTGVTVVLGFLFSTSSLVTILMWMNFWTVAK